MSSLSFKLLIEIRFPYSLKINVSHLPLLSIIVVESKPYSTEKNCPNSLFVPYCVTLLILYGFSLRYSYVFFIPVISVILEIKFLSLCSKIVIPCSVAIDSFFPLNSLLLCYFPQKQNLSYLFDN